MKTNNLKNKDWTNLLINNMHMSTHEYEDCKYVFSIKLWATFKKSGFKP